ncbi:MAG TPA: bacillithiol biosynthesis cysteine-adding enzyme BshC [Puia sp.]|nr:bacillithiol biosynthesis cysteine-adding enzyme BshC [Puia sp.]
MNCTATNLSYQQTGYFSNLTTDYLNGVELLTPFYKHPVSIEGIQSVIHDRERFKTPRTVLVEALNKQYSTLPVSKIVRKNIESLCAENTFTITTAHQPAIFTGTLFFIYKILHAIKLANHLSEQLPQYHFVPVYYMGNEDADLEELNHIYLDNEKIVWDTKQTGAVGRMKTTGLEKIIARIEGEFSVQPFGKELVELLKDSYLKNETVQSATFSLLNELFGKYGLIVLIPDSSILKRLMQPVFEDDLLNRMPSSIVEKTIGAFPEKYKVQANPREINLFYLKDNLRELIEFKNEQYEIRNTNIRFSKQEILAELSNNPGRFSPNVILRGLYQSTILPDIVFIGGGGEAAYWLELKNLFEHYAVPYPMLVLRNSFLIIEKEWATKINKAGFTMADVFKSENELISELVKKESTNKISLEKEITEAENFYGNLKSIGEHVDATLVQHVEALQAKALKEIKEFEKKLLRNEKRKFEDVRRQIHEIKSVLFPLNNLQERIENFIPYYARWGKAFIDLLYKNSLALQQEFVVLEEK